MACEAGRRLVPGVTIRRSHRTSPLENGSEWGVLPGLEALSIHR
jgi:hypothetical protein